MPLNEKKNPGFIIVGPYAIRANQIRLATAHTDKTTRITFLDGSQAVLAATYNERFWNWMRSIGVSL